MTRGHIVLVCAGLALAVAVQAGPPGKDESRIATTLAVQTALQQGRDYLLRGDPASAVRVLESQLANINGNREYLAALRDAYRGHVKNLRLNNKESEVQLYLRRLEILDPGAALDLKAAVKSETPPAKVRAQSAETASPTPPKARDIIAGSPSVEDPFQPGNHRRAGEARQLLARAEAAFRDKRYAEAGPLYAQVEEVVPGTLGEARERWAYCKLFLVVEKLNKPSSASDLPELEQEVRQAMAMAPKLNEYASELLKTIDGRKSSRPEREPAKGPARGEAISVRHSAVPNSTWQLAETPNFRIFHATTREYAEKAAQVAEQTRAAMQLKWFGQVAAPWNPRCDIYLHADGDAYARATGVPRSSPGHATIRNEGPRVTVRRIDLHIDDINLLTAVLPHEATHVVLAGNFGPHPVPRWADEGMAVLSEPAEKIDRHLRNLPRHLQARELFPIRQLMQLDDYPDPRYIGAFYAQSVSLVDYLCKLRGPRTFAAFLKDALPNNYESALKKHYEMSYNDLETRWRQSAFNSRGHGEMAEMSRKH